MIRYGFFRVYDSGYVDESENEILAEKWNFDTNFL